MKTIRERAGECCRNTHDHSRENDPHTICGITYQAERVLRELVEEIAVYLDNIPSCWDESVRRRFLGPPSAEEVVEQALAGSHIGDIAEFRTRRIAAEHAAKALREAGLLKEDR